MSVTAKMPRRALTTAPPSAPPTVVPAMARPDRIEANSFDVFDTLIARRCHLPWRVFEQIGARIGRPDFLQVRLAAEAHFAGKDYTLADIYARLATLWGLPAELAEQLKAMEVATELENVIPIQENLDKVRHGDVLVSDMYLPEAVIRSLLDEAGLDKRVALIVTTHGKRAGYIWPQLTEQVAVAQHLGDNALVDLEMPIRCGVNAELTAVSSPSHVESWLAQNGLPNLALAVREARLRTAHSDPALRSLQRIQIEINLPILLLASVQLARVAREAEAERLLFCSRDCELWLELWRVLGARTGVATESIYFLTSRRARRTASSDYLAYARSLLDKRALVVDICGTGWSLSHLFETLGLSGRHAFVIHHTQPLAMYEQQAPTPGTCTHHAAMKPEQPIPNVAIELINTAEHGSVIDVQMVAGTAVPIFDTHTTTPRVGAACAAQRAAFRSALDALKRHNLDEVFAQPPERIAALIQPLYELLGAQAALREVLFDNYLDESHKTYQALGLAVA